MLNEIFNKESVSALAQSKPMAIAVLDILGFGNLVEKAGIPQVTEVILNSISAVKDSGEIILHDYAKFQRYSGGNTPDLNYLQFSDTILIYLQADQSVSLPLNLPGQMIISMCYTVSMIISQCAQQGIALRGGIAFGECYISREPLYFVGRPIMEAIKMEREQEWAGAVLAMSADKALQEQNAPPARFVIPYKVPLKMGSKITPPVNAVNWVRSMMAVNAAKPRWEEMFSSPDSDVRKKRQNTETFFNYIKNK